MTRGFALFCGNFEDVGYNSYLIQDIYLYHFLAPIVMDYQIEYKLGVL